MQELAKRIAKVSKESKIEIDEAEYVASFKVELMDAVVQWCRGASFSDICKVSYSQFSRHKSHSNVCPAHGSI
jgi:ATP-dependent RNA helicase DOB1